MKRFLPAAMAGLLALLLLSCAAAPAPVSSAPEGVWRPRPRSV